MRQAGRFKLSVLILIGGSLFVSNSMALAQRSQGTGSSTGFQGYGGYGQPVFNTAPASSGAFGASSAPFAGTKGVMPGASGYYGSSPYSTPFATPYPPVYASPVYGVAPVYGGAPVVVVAPAPVIGRNGFYRFPSQRLHYWLAPSGYYYPWGYNPTIGSYPYGSPIYYSQGNQAQSTRPPLSSFFSDMLKYIEDQKSKGLISDADYVHLMRRLSDLRSKHDHLLVVENGTLEQQDEDNLYKDAYMLSGEIATRTKPAK